MGVVFQPNDYYALPAEAKCLYCGQALSVPYVVWQTAHGRAGSDAIGVHPACTVELTIRLLRDIHEIEEQTGRAITTALA